MRSVILSGVDNARARNVYHESFRNDYPAFGFLWQIEFFHRLVTSVNLAYGRTIHPMLATALGFAGGLGPKPWRRARTETEFFVPHHAAVFMSASFTEFPVRGRAYNRKGGRVCG